ncbi:MAG: carboxypeptidase regulatory-like domain-containing protein [Longimicrobiales bacterium]
MLRKAVTRLALTLAATVMFVTGSVMNAHAQSSTGKIQGRVTSAGQPVVGAAVTVVGTGLGNISDDKGLYFINEVPAGLVTVRVTALGYRTQELKDQRILGGNTTTLNFATLEPAAVELEALVITGDRNPLVPRDQVSSRSIVTGETIDKLPMDNAANIIRLQPGIITTNRGFSIRGSREGQEAQFIDGVPIRNLQTGETASLEVPTNALAQVDVTTGGISARFGNAQSGVVNYVTRSGGTSWGGSAAFQTDELSPKKIRFGFNRAEFSIGGPLPFLKNLSYFGAMTAEGNKYGTNLNTTLQDQYFPQYVPVGIDTVIRLGRTNASGLTGTGTTDSIDIYFPKFVDFDNGVATPGRQDDEFVTTNKLSLGLGRGSKLDFAHYFNRTQTLQYGTISSEGNTGNIANTNVFTLGGYFLISQAADRQIALDLKASMQRDYNQGGTVNLQYLADHRYPFLGFNVSSIDFAIKDLHDKFPVNDEVVTARRANLIPPNEDVLFPLYGELATKSGGAGLSENLRISPFANTIGVTQGLGNPGQNWNTSNRMYYTGTIDYQMTRYNRVWLGGDITMEDDKAFNVQTTAGASTASHYTPKFGGLFLEDRLDIGDVVLSGGVRMDYSDPNSYFSRVPGYVYNVPDSLSKDRYKLRSGSEPLADRLYIPEGDEACGGAATAERRKQFKRDADGNVIPGSFTGVIQCLDNFIPTKVRTSFSPKLAVSFPVTSNSTFRLSYGQNTQVPRLTGNGGILSGQLADLAGGANTNNLFGRDVDIPRTVLFEAGYRQVFGGSTVLDISAYSKTDRNSLSYRKLAFDNPNTGASIGINALVNADYSLTRGSDIKIDRRISNVADLALSYSFLDARGTGSDPQTYTSIFARGASNYAATTNTPIAGADILLPNDQSRAHSLAATFTMQLPTDYMSGNSVGHAILSDVGVFATGQLASGLPYTLQNNVGLGYGGPPSAGFDATYAEPLNSSRTSMFKTMDLRVTKGFQVAGKSFRAFADARNPFNLSNTNRVFLETGQTVNAVFRDRQIKTNLTSANLDGDVLEDDFDIMKENKQNAVNKYALLQAEKRYAIGEPDGIFTVDEQKLLFGDLYDRGSGIAQFKTSVQRLRLGLEINF